MSTRREFLKHTSAAGVVVATSAQAAKADKAAHKFGPRIRTVIRREETVLRHGGNGHGWHMSWASDDRQYVGLCDGAGFTDQPKAYYNTRMLAISGGSRDAKFDDLPGYPNLAMPTQVESDTRYYNFGTLALDGYLYQFMSTFNRSFRSDDLVKPDLNDLQRFNGAKLIYSPDNGRTWCNQDGSTPVVWEDWNIRSRETLVFFEEDQEAFSLLTVLQMGKNYEHNRDGYIYVYAPNGNTEGRMNELVMFRVPKAQILSRGAYEYFAGIQWGGTAKWSKDVKARKPVCTFPRGWVNTLVHSYAWHPSVVYNAPLGLYMMANWGMGGAPDGMWYGKPSYLGFWVAESPWGPWTQIHEETAWMPAGDKDARAYQPQISPKWISADGKSFWLVWSDFQGWRDFWRNLNANAEYGKVDLIRRVAIMRKYMPYYAFNVQRVDLVIA